MRASCHRFTATADIYGQSYFWQTYQQREIDLIEERDGKLFPIECKWSVKNDVFPPKEWVETYPTAEQFRVITPENYLDFVA
jgi:hypothetical protein